MLQKSLYTAQKIEQVKKGCLASASIDYVALGERTGQIAVDILGGKDAVSYPAVYRN